MLCLAVSALRRTFPCASLRAVGTTVAAVNNEDLSIKESSKPNVNAEPVQTMKKLKKAYYDNHIKMSGKVGFLHLKSDEDGMIYGASFKLFSPVGNVTQGTENSQGNDLSVLVVAKRIHILRFVSKYVKNGSFVQVHGSLSEKRGFPDQIRIESFSVKILEERETVNPA